jgi:hypothetical protein
MFQYFWEKISYVYASEETFDSLLRLMVKREKSDLISFLFKSKATKTLFLSMSFSYK